MHYFRFLATLLPVWLAFESPSQAALKLSALFDNNMVLQQQMSVPVWGWADPGSLVTVSFAGQLKTTRADDAGAWVVKLDPLAASSQPQTLAIKSGETVSLTNVLVGEVWLASGQSNMEKPIGQQPGQKPCFNYEQELAQANYPEIRIFKVGNVLSDQPLNDLKKFVSWQECSSNALNSCRFSAAAYFFGRDIHTNINVPVGLIESSWGGTKIEPWTPPVGFESIPSLASLATVPMESGKKRLTSPRSIFNAMISPLATFAIRGVIWYQGESNLMGGTNDYGYRDYDDRMMAMVNGWRTIWKEGDFPFYFVQIAPFKYFSAKIQRVPSRESLPEFWTIQSRAAHRISHSGMVVTTDLVNNLNDIHPRDKQDVGYRLALLALNKTYGRNDACASPAFESCTFSNGVVRIQFQNAYDGLKSRDGQPLNWFELAGPDGHFMPAQGRTDGDAVVLTPAQGMIPASVRFAWDETAEPNLCNSAGLPAEPFKASVPSNP